MNNLVIYCKSYRGDFLRVKRLAQSVALYNLDKIPFYISTPVEDLPLFEEILQINPEVCLLSDDEILDSNPAHQRQEIQRMPGGLVQQIVKSEFWRLGLCENYLCIDSDSEFIKPFRATDFLAPDGAPYTVISEGKDLLEFSARYYYQKISEDFYREANLAQEYFGREGKAYYFGPTPLVWSRRVWEAVENNVLRSEGISFADLIVRHPYEIRIYGEALLKYKPIPFWPCEPLFKAYLYESQFLLDQKRGINLDVLSKNYFGVVWQSNWQGSHFGLRKKNFGSRMIKRLKTKIRALSV